MYTLFINSDYTNLYLISQNSQEYMDYLLTKELVSTGTKKELLEFLQENYSEDLIEMIC